MLQLPIYKSYGNLIIWLKLRNLFQIDTISKMLRLKETGAKLHVSRYYIEYSLRLLAQRKYELARNINSLSEKLPRKVRRKDCLQQKLSLQILRPLDVFHASVFTHLPTDVLHGVNIFPAKKRSCLQTLYNVRQRNNVIGSIQMLTVNLYGFYSQNIQQYHWFKQVLHTTMQKQIFAS